MKGSFAQTCLSASQLIFRLFFGLLVKNQKISSGRPPRNCAKNVTIVFIYSSRRRKGQRSFYVYLKLEMLHRFTVTLILELSSGAFFKESEFFGVFWIFGSFQLYALECVDIRQLTAVFNKVHYQFNVFDDELSSRTLDRFLRSWDPGKLYFYQKDIDDLEKEFSKKLDDLIASGKCNAIDSIVNLYTRRFKERSKKVASIINMKHDFNVDEYLEIDRKKIAFASNEAELDERWRKRIKLQLLQLDESLKDIQKAKDKVAKRYELAEKRLTEETKDNVFSTFLNSFAVALDPHSQYMSADELEDFRIQTRLSLEGIGAVLRSDDGFTVIQSLVPGGAAFKSGKVKVDDKIIAVAQEKGEPVDIIDMDLREVVKLIRGKGGSTVHLTVVRDAAGKTEQMIIPIVREKVQLTDRTAKSLAVEVMTKDVGAKTQRKLKVGVVDLPSFYIDFEGQHAKVDDFRSSAKDLEKEIKKVEASGIDALVVDLRKNGGGSLTESISIAGMFFDKGPVVQIRESDGRVYTQGDDDGKTLYRGPLVVLISRQSASASEIFAGAIQDHKRGLIVGDDHTFGKGTVQNLNDIGGKLGATKITISKFYRPSGSSTQLEGVLSDIVFPSLFSEIEIGEKFYDYALPWDNIQSTGFKTTDRVTPYLPALRTSSSQRIDKDKAFGAVKSEILEFQKNKDKRTK